MRHYEIMLLIDSNDQLDSIIENYGQFIQSENGVVHREEKRLKVDGPVYPIKKRRKGYYVLLNIECEPATEREIKSKADFNDAVLRYFSIQRKEAIVTPSIFCQSAPSVKDNQTENPEKETVKTSDVKKKKYRISIDTPDEAFDYKNIAFLSYYLTDTKKIARRRMTGANAKQQNRLSNAIMHARYLGLLPYCDKYDQPESN